MNLRSRTAILTLVPLLLALAAPRPSGAEPAPRPAWVLKSDAHARIFIDVLARFSPESASQFGVEGQDTGIADAKPMRQERIQEALRGVVSSLEPRLAAETDPTVRQDLEILLDSARDNIRGNDLSHKLQVPYFDAVQVVFFWSRSGWT